MTMETISKASLRMVGVKAEEGISRRMAATLKVISGTTLQMALENILTDLDINTKDSGRITWPMEKDKLTMLMEDDTMGTSSITEDMVEVSLCKRAPYFKATSSKTNYRAKASWSATTVRPTEEAGRII
jgi:hypothetical protein